jgi:tRNA wybutosine-synthesizing protein 3
VTGKLAVPIDTREQTTATRTTMSNSFLPDFFDNPADVLPSFHSIRQRTHDTLYAYGVDKSPKGSIDAPIRELVDLINKHPSFATLSSCSGRIALFDPVRADPIECETEYEEHTSHSHSDRIESGKGSGGWLFVSHEPVEVNSMETLFRSGLREGHTCSFRLEPMLLHIAAANLERGQQLMKLALALGFRESGMVVTPSRVTVAVRSYGLALNVPMAQSGAFQLPEAYWRELMEEANRRLVKNSAKIQDMYDEIEATLFQPRQPIYVSPLPRLNLWGHAAITVSGEHKGMGITDIIVFGGYGNGPNVSDCEQRETHSSRSDKIYRLRRHGRQWHSHWELLHSMDETDVYGEATTRVMGLVCQQTPWMEREFSAACVIPTEIPVLCVFGGRTSPKQPLGDLLICNYNYSSYAIAQIPLDVRGELPPPRWGHSLTALSGKNGRLAVLVGGRNEMFALASVHVLSIIRQDETNDTPYLLWETVSSPPFTGTRFHHATISVDDQVLVFGGSRNVQNVIETFSTSQKDDLVSFSFNSIDPSGDTRFQAVKGISPRAFGLSSTLVQADGRCAVLLCGGISNNSQSPVQLFELSSIKRETEGCFRPVKLISDGPVDFGALVHHQCVAFPSVGSVLEIAVIGGGVQGFGFQQIFAHSYILTLDLKEGTAIDMDRLTPILIKRRLSTRLSDPCPTNEAALSDDSNPGLSDVLYVKRQDAKLIKTLLESTSFLNMTYRMSSVADGDTIAVPVTRACLAALESGQDLEWKKLVRGRGKQVLPYRSATFARRGK